MPGVKMPFEFDGVVEIAHDLHIQSPEAQEKLFAWLSDEYELVDGSKDERHPAPGFWFARLKNIQDVAKCSHCGGHNEFAGVEKHMNLCVHCGKPLCVIYAIDAILRFRFRGSDQTLRMKIIETTDTHMVLERIKPSWLDVSEDKIDKVLEDYRQRWTPVADRRIRVEIPTSSNNPNDIVLWEILGKRLHYHRVVLYKGNEYPEYGQGKLNVERYVSIYETYRKAPLAHTGTMHQAIILAAGMVYDCGYYYQDEGRVDFHWMACERMTKYVKHFTDIPLDKWNKFLGCARKNGPGMIVDLASFCEALTGVPQEVENRPNVCNAIIGISKLGRGHLSDGEMAAFLHAMSDERIADQVARLVP